MRKFIPILISSIILSLVILAGCKKEDDKTDDSQYFIRYKADGQLIEHKNEATLFAVTGQSGVQHNAVVSGFTGNTNISIQAFDNKPIAASIYNGYELKMNYVEGAILGFGRDGSIYGTDGTNPNVLLNITTWSSTEARGTFSGVVKLTSGALTITITEGEFYVKRTN